MHEQFDPVAVAENRIGDNLGAEDIRLEEKPVVEDGASHMRFGGKMQDDVGPANQRIDDIGVQHIAVPEFKPVLVETVLWQIVDAPGIGQRIEDDDLVVGIFFIEVADEVAADESGAPRDKKRLHVIPFQDGYAVAARVEDEIERRKTGDEIAMQLRIGGMLIILPFDGNPGILEKPGVEIGLRRIAGKIFGRREMLANRQQPPAFATLDAEHRMSGISAV